MTDCDELREQHPGWPLGPCCRICHARGDFTPARVEGRSWRVCCSVFSTLARCQENDLIDLLDVPPEDAFAILDDLVERTFGRRVPLMLAPRP